MVVTGDGIGRSSGSIPPFLYTPRSSLPSASLLWFYLPLPRALSGNRSGRGYRASLHTPPIPYPSFPSSRRASSPPAAPYTNPLTLTLSPPLKQPYRWQAKDVGRPTNARRDGAQQGTARLNPNAPLPQRSEKDGADKRRKARRAGWENGRQREAAVDTGRRDAKSAAFPGSNRSYK